MKSCRGVLCHSCFQYASTEPCLDVFTIDQLGKVPQVVHVVMGQLQHSGTQRKCDGLAQGLGLVFVAVYQRALKLLYVDNLLEAVKQEFADSYFKPKQYDYPKFEATYMRLLAEAEARADAALRDRSNARAFQGKKVSL